MPTWVCFQGGEPLDQPDFVKSVIDALDDRFKVAIYTGYAYNLVKRRHSWLFSHPKIYMIKAGPFMQAKRVYNKFLATTNQQLFYKDAEKIWNPLDWTTMEVENLFKYFA